MTAEQTLLQKRIQDLLDYADKLAVQHWEEQKFSTPPSVHRIRSIGPQWCKIGLVTRYHGHPDQDTAIYAFISMRDGHTSALGKIPCGGIYMPASHLQPAKNVRGSIFDEDFGDCLTHSGVKYMSQM